MKTYKLVIIYFLFLIISEIKLIGQVVIYEAENGTLTGVSVSSADPGYSGTGYIAGNTFDQASDMITVNVSVANSGKYTLSIGYRDQNGHKENNVLVNDVLVGSFIVENTTGFTEKVFDIITLNQGANTIALGESWGWIDVDYFKIGPVAPKGDFSITPVKPVINKVTSFNATNIIDQNGYVASYEWNFGDGTTDTGKIVQHIFVNPGKFSVELLATDNDGNTSGFNKVVQVITGTPHVSFNYSPSFPSPGVQVNFNASKSSDEDGTIQNYQWIFSDEDTLYGNIVTRTFNTEGIFRVMLRVTDNDAKIADKEIFLFVNNTDRKISDIQFMNEGFKTFEKAEAVFQIRGNYTNVYNPDEVQVDAVIHSPDEDSAVIPCFYFIKGEYNSEEWKIDSTYHYWMVRFSPTEVGKHKIKIRVIDNQGITYSNQDSIDVDLGNQKGFIQIDKNNKQYYRHTTGEPYFPIGINIAWTGGAITDKMTDYHYFISNLSQNKSNWMRYWLAPFASQALEWKNGNNNGIYHGLGKYSQEGAATLDSILDICNQNEFYLQLAIFQHGMVSETVDAAWSDNPYNTSNGGYLNKAGLFFSNENAKKQIKKLLRYIVARWGYSTNLYAWELFNEVQFAGNFPNENITIDISAWHDEMSKYIDSIDSYHHIKTTSADRPLFELMNNNEALDQLQFHVYSDNLLNDLNSSADAYSGIITKSYMNGEFGLNKGPYTADLLRKCYWNGLMKQSPVSFWYQDIIKNNDWFGIFKPLGNFTENYDFLTDGAIKSQPATAGSPDIKLNALALESNKKAYAFVYDVNNGINISDAKLYIKGLPYGYYEIHYSEPETGDSLMTENVPLIRNTDIINLPLFSKEIATKIIYTGDYKMPIAIAGEDTTIAVGQSILLNGGKSYNPSGAALEYEWFIVSKPDASDISIQNSTLKEITLLPDVPGIYLFGLYVNDTANTSLPDQVIIKVSAPPVAVAPNDTMVLMKIALKLNGGRSYDPENDSLTYKWELISAPEESKSKLFAATSMVAKITPDFSGQYVIKLNVNDGYSTSEPDTVIITAVETLGIFTYEKNPGANLYIHPNPVHSMAYITYSTGRDGRLDILDLNGKIIKSILLDKDPVSFGQITLNFNDYNISGGLYLVRLISNKDCIVKKVIYNP